MPYNPKLQDKIVPPSEISDQKTTSIKEQIRALDRPPTPEEKLACCMEDLAIFSSTDNPTTEQASSTSMADATEEKLPATEEKSPATVEKFVSMSSMPSVTDAMEEKLPTEDIFMVDRRAREKKEKRNITI